MSKPFEGIRVIDTTHVLAGPFAAYQLALLGADVIKVEHPDDPDFVRGSGSSKALNDAKIGSLFMTQNSNKRAITVDLKKESGREVLKKLVAGADVFVENYRPGAIDGLGLGYDVMSAINPGLIYCSVSAFGHEGPRSTQTAYDNVIQASAGIMWSNGAPETAPMKVGFQAVDYATGTMAAFALSSALFQRERTGKGQRIDLAMFDVALMLLGAQVSAYSVGGKEPKPPANNFHVAGLGCYETKDGHVMTGAANQRQQKRMWEALGYPEMVKNNLDERHADVENERALLRRIFKERTSQEWEDFLQEHHVPCCRVRTLAEALQDPQLENRAVLHEHAPLPEHDRPFKLPAAAFTFAHDGPSVDRPPPRLGEHTDEILSELGYNTGQIAALRDEGAI